MKSEVNLFKSMDISAELKQFCIKNGADLVGIADLTPLKSHLVVIPEDLLNPYTFGISIAIHLNDAIMDAIVDQPTPEYAELYLQTNAKLDEIAEKLLAWITRKKHAAIHIPACAYGKFGRTPRKCFSSCNCAFRGIRLDWEKSFFNYASIRAPRTSRFHIDRFTLGCGYTTGESMRSL